MAKVNVKKRETLSDVFKNIASGITGVYVFIILAIFPLYTHDMYFDILGARYMFFKIWAISLVVILSLLGILYMLMDYSNKQSAPCAFYRFFTSFAPKNIKKHIVITDIFYVAMLIVCIISTLNSGFKEEALTGNAGRYQGLECWILYTLTYFAITRTFKFKKMYLNFALLAGVIACLWGDADFLWLDPFGFFKNVNYVQHTMFASSIGNLNTYTNYTAMIFAIGSVLFYLEDNFIWTIIYFIASVIGATGSVFGLADNAVLGFFAFYLFLPFFRFKTRRDFVRYFWLIDSLLISLFLFWIAIKYPHNSGQSAFFLDLIAHKEIVFMFIPWTIITIIIWFVMIKIKPNYGTQVANNLKPIDSILPKQIKIGYVVVVILGFSVVTYILLDMNIFKQHVDLWRQLPSSHQLVFDDNWGTHRGHNWRIAFTNFTQNFDWMKRLFGYGPDTYLVVSERTFYEEMVQRYGEVYDSAHNEYINYLICEGVLGLISYLGIFISGICYGLKVLKKEPLILVSVMAVVCYMVQAIVNIAIPITTPIFFTLMYIGVATYFDQIKNANSENIVQ